MDQGFENAAIISLFTRSGYWGNSLFKKQSQKIGSEYEAKCNKPIQSLITINDITDAAEQALKWFKDEKIMKSILIEVTNPKSDHINTSIILGASKLSITKNGTNWTAQISNPAHAKFPEDK